MRYRDKLILLMVSLALVTGGVLTAISYFLTREILVEEIKSKVLSTAATAAAFVDPALHRQIHGPRDQNSPTYKTLEEQLRRVRDANRRGDVYIRFVYTMMPSTEAKSGAAFVVDAEEDGPDKSPVGQLHDPKQVGLPPLNFNDYNFETFVTDQYGTWLSAFAPLRDETGRSAGLLGVDMAAHDVLAKTNSLLWSGLTAMAVAMLLALGLSLFVARRATRSLDALGRAVERISAGDFDARVELNTQDEFAKLGQALNAMGPQLRENMRLRASLALAMEVQQRLLPAGPPQLPGFDIAGSSIYCDETGGDYYDFLELSELGARQIGVAVGDVTGHGISAALLMASVRALLRSRVNRPGGLSEVLTDINRHLAADSLEGRFMTLFYLVLDADNRGLRWACAGHDPAICYQPATGTFEQLRGGGIPLGIEPDWVYTESSEENPRPGQIIVVGTDGVWETRNAAGKLFGKDALCDLIRRHAAGSAQEIRDEIIKALAAYRHPLNQEDDVTLVVIKVR